MNKVKMLKDDKYAKRGIFITQCLKGKICEVPEEIAKAFIERGSAIHHKEKQVIEMPKSPVLETQDMDLSGMEYKQLNEMALKAGFVNEGKGRASKVDLIEFLRGQDG